MLMRAMMLSWDIGTFLNKGGQTLKQWAGYLIVIFGIAMLVAAVYMLTKGLIGQGKGQPVPWMTILLLIVIGGALLAGGFSFLETVAGGGKKTIEDLGQTIIPMFLF